MHYYIKRTILFGLILLMCLFIFFCGFSTVSYAATPAITISSVACTDGDTVDIVVSLSNNPGIVSLSLDISYDTKNLTLVKAMDGGTLKGWSSSSSEDELKTSPYRLIWNNDSRQIKNGDLAVLTFKVTENVACKAYKIQIVEGAAVDMATNEIPMSFKSVGTINVSHEEAITRDNILRICLTGNENASLIESAYLCEYTSNGKMKKVIQGNKNVQSGHIDWTFDVTGISEEGTVSIYFLDENYRPICGAYSLQ